ncbi:MAG: hypothetical protein C0606_15705 [Hyphomicrobiales bacterium]|nr:MAG: hypothetical protein C0606_15705 [Hyphomicrobiales bacterium]
MASIYDLKPRFQAFLRPLVVSLAKAGVTANMVTLAALGLSLLAALLLAVSAGFKASLLLLPLVLFVRMALNAIDGMLAREHDQKSQLGAILNEVADVLSDLALYLALVPALAPYGAAAVPIVFFVIGAIITEFAGVLAQALGAGRRYDGPMGKSDRAFVIGTLAVAVALFPIPWVALDGIFVMLAIATVLTAWKRCAAVLAA